jgi:putative serine protease PepD
MHDDDTEQPGTPGPTEPTASPWSSVAPADTEVTTSEATSDEGGTALPPPIPPPLPPPPTAPSWPLPPAGDPAAPPVGPPSFGAPAAAAPLPPNLAPSTSGPSGPPSKGRQWIAVAVIAAIIGALVGAGVTAIADHNGNGNGNVTIHESNAAPGAATLGNVSIVALVKKVEPAVVSIDVKAGGSEDQGTGMIVTANGEVITNNHVIELYSQNGNSGTITVTEYGQTKAEAATLIGYDATKDVALLRITGASNLPTVTFGNSTKSQVGDAVVAIGNALGLAAGTPTVTQGIVSALGRSVTAGGDGTAQENLQNLIQTDAAINPGNSGGPLIDTAGEVIGMNTAVAGTSDAGQAQNIGFAIPIAQVESLIPALEKGGSQASGGGYLGVDITTLTSSLRQQYGFTPSSGAVILDVISGSPAAKAGLAQGDVIVDIGFTPITSAEQLQNAIEKDKPGQSITVTYYEGDNRHMATVTLGNQAEAQQQESSGSSGSLGGGAFPGLGGG